MSKRLIVDGQITPFESGDTVLAALLRADKHPTGGGCLCCAGDCPYCLTTVDGVSYVRSCQTTARAGMVVERHHLEGYPPLPFDDRRQPEIDIQHLHYDVAVVGGGEAGQQARADAETAGKDVILLDAEAGQEVIGIYEGILVVARSDTGMINVHCHEVVVATGSAEIQPVCEGNQLTGLVTARAASQLASAGIDLGHIVAIGSPPVGLVVEQVAGQLVRCEGKNRLEAVVIENDGEQRTIACDTLSLNLGIHPRDALVRMGRGLNVSAVGDCALPSDIPPCPSSGTVCACSGVKVADLEAIWQQGFHELELLKRATLAGTGSCQGSVCLPHLRSFLQERGQRLQAPFTARPVTRQLTLGEIAAGHYHQATPRTALDAEHRRLGAQMDRIGGWWRPWNYGKVEEEYWAVREAVSLGDVSTLGKIIVAGPDALAFLERLYPTKIATIKTGRSRYVLLLNERGYVFDDGLVSKDDDNRYNLTFTSGGSSHAEMWLRDWAESWHMDVRILNQTYALGAINVTGPLAKELLERAGLERPPGYMRHLSAEVAGVHCTIYRLSFTGELSFELHHPVEDSLLLWHTLFELGQDLGIKAHGLEALEMLRLEKGHILVNVDTDFDSTPRRLQHEWAVKLDKADFVGKQALLRTNAIPLDRVLVGLEMEAEAAFEGSILLYEGNYAGYVTSSSSSPVLGKSVMLAWLRFFDGALPTQLTINGQPARRTSLPFYDPEASRARA